MTALDDDAQVEWRLTWFPPDTAEEQRTYRHEAAARAAARKLLEHNPILERRTVVTSGWSMVENLAPGWSK